MSKVVVVTGGGTGGHLSVAKAFVEQFYKKGYKVIFIGSTKGQDRLWFEDEPKLYKKYFMETRGVVNQSKLGKLISLWMIFKAVIKSILIIKKYNVSKVISVGGFSASAASFGAILTKTDFYIHEQNSVMGRLNKLTSKYAKEVFSSYDKNSKIKDYPINEIFFEHQRVRSKVKSVIFLGGSQGANDINQFALKVAPILDKMGIKIVHQAGKNGYKDVKKEYEKLNIDVDLFDFTNDLISKMDSADFAVSRAGASTLWELVALGIPTLFIPYPYAAANHQYFNAKFLVDNDLAFLQTKDSINIDKFIEIIKQDHTKRSEKLLQQISKDGIEKIVEYIEK